MYRDTKKNTSDKTQFSIAETSDGRKYVDVDTDQTLFDGLDTSDKRAMAKMVIQEYFPAGTEIELDGETFYVSNRTPKEYAYAEKNRGKKRLQEDKIFVEDVPFESVKSKHPEAIGGIDTYETMFKVQNRWYKGTVNIINRANGKEIYDVTKIKSIGANEVLNNESYLATQSNASDFKIPQSEQNASKKSQQDGKTVGTLEYSEYDGEPSVKMVEVDENYRRKGIGTKLAEYDETLGKFYNDEIELQEGYAEDYN